MFEYKPKSNKQLRADYNRRSRNNDNRFVSFEDFKDWYHIQQKICSYCGIKEEECQKIVVSGLLESKRFPLKGKILRGRARGMWLEVDKMIPKDGYSRSNCVLACYFCNNDKSDVFNYNQYKSFQSNRLEFLKGLL